MHSNRTLSAAILLAVALVTVPASAEVIEEIVAWVDGDIITKSELEDEERLITEELYRQYTGDELDQQLAAARANLLQQMIDRKILMHRAERVFDLDSLGDGLVDDFRRRNEIESDAELERMLAAEGLTREELKRRLLENLAPAEIVRIEVDNRVSVGSREVEEFYEANPELFTIPTQFTLREIVVLADDADREDKREFARDLRERVAAPDADFAAVAEEFSDAGTASSGGLLGPSKKGDLNPELERVGLELPVGDVSEILEMPYGFHIVKVVSRTDERLRPLDEIRNALRQNLENRKRMERLDEFLEQAREESEWRVAEGYRDRL